MSEKKVIVLLCDLPHKREVRAVDTLTINGLSLKKELSVDVCSAHAEMVLGNAHKPHSESAAPRKNGVRSLSKAEQLDKMPAGWIDTEKAAEELDVSRAGVLHMRTTGKLKGRSVSIPGRRNPLFIYARSAVRALASARA